MKKLLLLFILLGMTDLYYLQAQEASEKKEPPAFMNDSADEDYKYLRDEETAEEYEKMFAQNLKFIGLNADKTVYLSLGGSYRPRFESTINENYTTEDDSYYSHRLSLHTNLNLGEHFRFFGELFHGFTSGGEERSLEDDELALHQAFVELSIPSKQNEFVFTFGRKQLTYGAGRLLDRRD